jgi:hypothetical protein
MKRAKQIEADSLNQNEFQLQTEKIKKCRFYKTNHLQEQWIRGNGLLRSAPSL